MAISTALKSNLARELEDNLIKFFANLDVELSFTIGLSRIVTGIPHPLLNCVARTHYTPRNAAEEIEKTISHFKWRKLPFTWWTDAHSTPANLGILLESCGLTHLETFAGLALELSEPPCPMPKFPHLRIGQIIDSEQMAAWAAILEKVYLFTPSIARAYSALYLQKVWMPNQYIRPYLAAVNETPVGSFALFIAEGTAEIYHLSILPEARSQGIGTSIVEELKHIARELGCRRLLLRTPSKTVILFQKLGFQSICTFDAYVWPGTEVPDHTHSYDL